MDTSTHHMIENVSREKLVLMKVYCVVRIHHWDIKHIISPLHIFTVRLGKIHIETILKHVDLDYVCIVANV